MIPIRIEGGEQKAWETISSLDPEDIQKRAAVTYESALGIYTIRSFGMDFRVSLQDRTILSSSPLSGLLLSKLKDFFRLSLLWYLASSKDIALTGRLIRPLDVKGGHRFFTGTHTLPLNDVAKTFSTDKERFLRKARSFGGELFTYGDASVKLLPLPRVPVDVLLWLEDDEFPARADLLFDSTCDLQIPLSDLIWSVAMMSLLVMLE